MLTLQRATALRCVTVSEGARFWQHWALFVGRERAGSTRKGKEHQQINLSTKTQALLCLWWSSDLLPTCSSNASTVWSCLSLGTLLCLSSRVSGGCSVACRG